MTTKRAFISFDYDNDKDLRNALVGQAKYPNSPFEIVTRPSEDTCAVTG